jgi:hypothetical protein
VRVLITNNTLDVRAGTETYLLDVARALRRRGHEPVAYSTALGAVARELAAEGIETTDDLDATRPPDLVHGQHHVEAMTALLRFRGVPAIYVCHGALPWEEAPPLFPRIRRYVAVDDACRDRCLADGVPASRLRVIHNSVDLERFTLRTDPLPPRPRRALVLGNRASKDTYVPAVAAACAKERIACDVRGWAAGDPAPAPHEILGSYDLVFAKGRAALEAMATGAAVVLCDAQGSGPMVTAAEFDGLRAKNFGFRTLTEPLDAATLAREIRLYDPAGALEVARRVRAEAGLEPMVDALVATYEEALLEHRSAPTEAEEEARAAARYVRTLGGLTKKAAAAAGYYAVKRSRKHASRRGVLARILRRSPGGGDAPKGPS